MHPDFNPDTIENDIAMVQFIRPAGDVTSLSLIYPPVFDLYVTEAYGIGWSSNSNGENLICSITF